MSKTKKQVLIDLLVEALKPNNEKLMRRTYNDVFNVKELERLHMNFLKHKARKEKQW